MIAGIVVGRDRFRIGVDHDGLKARLLQSEGSLAATIIELDALAYAVWPAA